MGLGSTLSFDRPVDKPGTRTGAVGTSLRLSGVARPAFARPLRSSTGKLFPSRFIIRIEHPTHTFALPRAEVRPSLVHPVSSQSAISPPSVSESANNADRYLHKHSDSHTNTSSTVMRSAQLPQCQPVTNAIQNLARIIDIPDSEDDLDEDEDAAVSAAISARLLDAGIPRRQSVRTPAALTTQASSAMNTSSEAADPAAASSEDCVSLASTSTSIANQPKLIVGQVFDDEAAFVQASSSAIDASQGSTSRLPPGTVSAGQQRQGDLLWVSCRDPLCHASVSSTTVITTDNINRHQVATVRLTHRPQCDPRRWSRPSDNYYDDSYDYGDTATPASMPRRLTRSSNPTLAWPVSELASPAANSAPASRSSSEDEDGDDDLPDIGTGASGDSQPTSVMFTHLHQAATRAKTRSIAVAAAAQCGNAGGDLVRGATFSLDVSSLSCCIFSLFIAVYRTSSYQEPRVFCCAMKAGLSLKGIASQRQA